MATIRTFQPPHVEFLLKLAGNAPPPAHLTMSDIWETMVIRQTRCRRQEMADLVWDVVDAKRIGRRLTLGPGRRVPRGVRIMLPYWQLKSGGPDTWLF